MSTLLPDLTPVEKVAVLALRLRALDARSARPILGDPVAAQIADAIGLDLARPRIPRSVVLVHAVRARTLDALVRRFTHGHPGAVVVDLGCGLDARRLRVAPPAGTDWYGVDLPGMMRLRDGVVPDDAVHRIAADVTSPDWLRDVPRDRPAIVVNDGLLALLTAGEFIGTARALTAHFAEGELVFNAYSRLSMRNARRMRTGPLSGPAPGEGIDDPREPESWDARLELVEELSVAHAPEVAQFPPVLRAITRIGARSAWMIRTGDRVVRYRFPA